MYTRIKTTPSTNGANQTKWLHVGECKQIRIYNPAQNTTPKGSNAQTFTITLNLIVISESESG